MKGKRILCAALAWLLCLPFFPAEPVEAENPDFQTYFYDDFVTGYQPGDTAIIGYENTVGKLTRVEDGDNAYMQLVNVNKNLSGADFRKDLTPYIEGKPKLVLEFRYQPNLNNSSSIYKDVKGRTETFCIQRAAPRGYKDKENGTVLEDLLLPYYLTEWHTVTIVYDNEKEERTIFIDGVTNHNKYPNIQGNSYANTGKFVWSGYTANKIDGWFNIDYAALYEYQDQFDFVVENAQNTETDRINVLFNFPVKAGTEVTADNFSIDGNRVSAVERDPINPRKYTLTFETPLKNSAAYTLQAAGVTDIDDRQLNSTKTFRTKEQALYLEGLELENFTLGTSGTYKIKANAVNETASDIQAFVFVTAYDEKNAVSALDIASLSIPAGANGPVETTVALDGEKVKQKCTLFAVQSLESLSPISGKTSYDSSGMKQGSLNRDCGVYEGNIALSYATDYEKQVVTPQIRISDTASRDGVFAVLRQEGAVTKENLAFVDLFSTENGEASLPVTLTETSTFYGIASLFKSEQTAKKDFEFFDTGYIEKALPALNAAADKAGIGQFFEDYGKACNLDLEPYEALSHEGRDYILNAVLETKKELDGSYASIDAFQEKLAGLYRLAAFYYQGAGMAQTADNLPADDAVKNLYQEELSEETVTAAETALRKKECFTEESFLKALHQAVVLTGVEKAEHYKQTRKIITDCRELIGISDAVFAKYNGLRQKEKVDQKLTGVSFGSFEQLSQAFSDETDNQKKKEQNTGGGNSGTGGSGSGGTASRPSGNNGQTTWIPNVPDKDTEDPIKKPEEPTVTPTPVPGGEYPFSDMGNTRWARSAVRYLHIKKAVQGKEEGKFAPEDMVTRAEFVTMAVKAFELSKGTDGANPFKDVEEDVWYHDSVLSAYQAGIVSGVESDIFSPEQNITREMAAVILYKLAGNKTFGETRKGFTDGGSISPYAVEAVGKLAGKGIIGGYEDGSFRPNGSLTRAEAAVLIFRLLTAV